MSCECWPGSRKDNFKVSQTATAVALLSAAWLTSVPNVTAQERVLGTDVSYWNCGTSATGISQANWNTAYSVGNRQFVFIRATRGGTTGLGQTSGTPSPHQSLETLSRRYDDPRFIQNITRATAAGMLAGPYHFARPDVEGNTGTDEADHFVQMAGPWMRPGYLMPVFDQEAGAGADALVQFALDFSQRVYELTRIRPAMYINGNYSSIFQSATLARRNALAQPAAYSPSVVGPAYPMLWNARYSDNDNPNSIPVQTGSPKTTFTTLSVYYGPWDDYGDTEPWAFWQYASTVSIPGLNAVDTTCDANVAHGDIEYVRNFLVPAVWWHDLSGDWSTLTNWNSGQPVVAPVTPPDQTPPYATGPLPVSRLPGAAGTGPTSGQYDTVILERPTANITVTLSSGVHNIRKLYMRETLAITGGALTINYNPTYRPDNSATVRHGGPISAQFSGPVSMSGGNLSVHTLQVDPNQTFALSGGTLTFNTINLMPHANAPAKISVNGAVTINPLSNAMATVNRGSGSGLTGSIDLSGGTNTLTIGNGSSEIDLSLNVPLANGAFTKAGVGTMELKTASSYSGGTIVSAGRLLVNNPSGSGTGSGAVVVNLGTLGGTGTISGVVTVNASGTLAPGNISQIGTLKLSSAPVLGGTTSMRINRNNGTPLCDRIALSGGTLSYGGALQISNEGAALTGGETFTLFSAPAFAGSFSTYDLPTLGPGMNWYIGHLTVNGSISVNRSPVAGGATFTNDAPNVLLIPVATLIANATDADGDTLELAGVDATSTNGVPLAVDGGFIVYSNFVSVADQFNYTLSDGRGGSASGTVQIAANLAGRFVGAPSFAGDSMAFQFVGTPGWTYYVDRSTNLPTWTTIWTNVAPASGFFEFTDDFSDFSEPPASAFYRLRW